MTLFLPRMCKHWILLIFLAFVKVISETPVYHHFKLSVFNYKWEWASSHNFIGHLFFLPCELPVLGFCPFVVLLGFSSLSYWFISLYIQEFGSLSCFRNTFPNLFFNFDFKICYSSLLKLYIVIKLIILSLQSCRVWRSDFEGFLGGFDLNHVLEIFLPKRLTDYEYKIERKLVIT